jgi:hypothetical protein
MAKIFGGEKLKGRVENNVRSKKTRCEIRSEERGYILTVLGKNKELELKQRQKRKSEGQKTSGGAPNNVGRATWALFPLVTPFHQIFRETFLFCKKS